MRLLKAALPDFGVQRGEEQVLQHGAVVGIARRPVIVPQQPGDGVRVEQLLGHQPFLFDEPGEQQPGNEADEVFFRRQSPGAGGGELGSGRRPLEPLEQIGIEAAVERLGVQRVQPGRQQPVEAAGLAVAVGVHPAQSLRQRQLAQDVQMGAVGVGGIDFPHQRNPPQHIPVGINLIGAAVQETQRDPAGGGAEQHDHRRLKALVDFPGKGGIPPARIAVGVEVDGGEQKAAGIAAAETAAGRVIIGGEQPPRSGWRNFALRKLKQQPHRLGLLAQGAFPGGVGIAASELAEEVRHRPRLPGQRPFAAVTQRRQQPNGRGVKFAIVGDGAQGVADAGKVREVHIRVPPVFVSPLV